MMVPSIEVKDLSQEFHLTEGPLQSLRVEEGKITKEDKAAHAVDKVNFQIEKGEVSSLVERSGCDKSITVRTIIRLLEPSGGQVLYKGEDTNHLSPRELLPYGKSMQMILQDSYASLNPRQRMEDIIMEPMLFHGVAKDRSDAREQHMNIPNRVGLRPEQTGRYLHQFSDSQRRRTGTARALVVKPRLIIADEPVSAPDVSTQAQILDLFTDLEDEFHFSCLFAAHDLFVVCHISNHLGVMYLGALVEVGNKQTLFQNPLHPYTKVLFSVVPTAGERPLVKHIDTTGEIPSPVNLSKGCFFCKRCPYVTERCHREHPEFKETESGHQAACHIL